MTAGQFESFIATSVWIFAKTMPHIPHEYTLRKHAADEAEFEAAVMFIRGHGYQARWGKYNHTYFDVDGWQYWTMGAPLAATILINRADLGGPGATR